MLVGDKVSGDEESGIQSWSSFSALTPLYMSNNEETKAPPQIITFWRRLRVHATTPTPQFQVQISHHIWRRL
jgi:hypothetical protein